MSVPEKQAPPDVLFSWLFAAPAVPFQPIGACNRLEQNYSGGTNSLTTRLCGVFLLLVGMPIHRMSFFSFDMIPMAISTLRASYTLRRMFFFVEGEHRP